MTFRYRRKSFLYCHARRFKWRRGIPFGRDVGKSKYLYFNYHETSCVYNANSNKAISLNRMFDGMTVLLHCHFITASQMYFKYEVNYTTTVIVILNKNGCRRCLVMRSLNIFHIERQQSCQGTVKATFSRDHLSIIRSEGVHIFIKIR